MLNRLILAALVLIALCGVLATVHFDQRIRLVETYIAEIHRGQELQIQTEKAVQEYNAAVLKFNSNLHGDELKRIQK